LHARWLTDKKASDVASKQLEAHIKELAYIGVYIGFHKCKLFSRGFNAKTVVAAAQSRWNHDGESSLQIPPTLSEAITAELSGETKVDVIAGSQSIAGLWGSRK